jgi:hypothetical protein
MADISWQDYNYEKDGWMNGTFPKQLKSDYYFHIIGQSLMVLDITNVDPSNQTPPITFRFDDQCMVWMHDDRLWSTVKKCANSDKIYFANPKCFEYFISIICLLISDVNVSRFIIKRLINKPKYRSMFKEGRMRYIRRKMMYALDCEDVHNLLFNI